MHSTKPVAWRGWTALLAGSCVAGGLWSHGPVRASETPRCDPLDMAALVAERPARSLFEGRDRVTWAVEAVRGYLFIGGRVNGVDGVFMLDTGTPFPFLINNHRVPLGLTDYLCTGTAGSGQALAFYRHHGLVDVNLADWPTGGFAALPSADLGFVTNMSAGGIRQDLLGFAGLPLLRDHEFVLDLRAGTLEIRPTDEHGVAAGAGFDPAERVATLSFAGAEGQQGVPSVPLQIGGVELEGHLDTGSSGTLTLRPESRQRLIEGGHLRRVGERYLLDGLTYRGVALTAHAESLAEGEHDGLGLGHNLLGHYRSVWNYRRGTVVLLRHRSGPVHQRD